MPRVEAYDYIIVGAGSAGCTLANRLSAVPGVRVLILEAGGWDRDPWLHIPLAWARLLNKRLHDWMYFTEPEAELGGRRIECARGKVIGGSSSINAMTYARGHPADFDRWAATGLSKWSYAKVLPYFRKQESWEGGADFYRGGDGPLTTRFSRYQDPLVEAFISAGQAAGYPITDDYNGAQPEGFARLQSTIREGRRCSAASAYLQPARRRPNLTIRTKCLATRICLEATKAVGIEYQHAGVRHIARADREVILAAGVINSPHLLMLSGIGDPSHLKAHGISVTAAVPGVGRNLQDHISVAASYLRTPPTGPLTRAMRLDRITIELMKAYLLGRGIATDIPGGATAFIKSSSESRLPDLQLLLVAGSFQARPYLPPFQRKTKDQFGIRAVLLRPESKGQLLLRSADPSSPPQIFQNFLSRDNDRISLRRALRLSAEIARQRPLENFRGAELFPWSAGDPEIDQYIAATAITVHHPLGTCKMGFSSDEEAVVDEDLRVIGTDGLRVVDASIMPDTIRGTINAAVIMIAERASDLILNLEARLSH